MMRGHETHEPITAASAVRELKSAVRQCDIWIREHLYIQQLLPLKPFPGTELKVMNVIYVSSED